MDKDARCAKIAVFPFQIFFGADTPKIYLVLLMPVYTCHVLQFPIDPFRGVDEIDSEKTTGKKESHMPYTGSANKNETSLVTAATIQDKIKQI